MATTTIPRPLRARRAGWDARLGMLAIGAGLFVAAAARMPGALGRHAAMASTAFVSLFVESLPFLIVGGVVVAMLRARPGARLLAAARRHPRLAAALAPLSGAALPLCDCGVVPIARELRSSGLRASIVNGFVAGAPLSNPIVVLSTLVAFPGRPGMVVGRVVVGLGVAAMVAAMAPAPVIAEPAGHDGHEDHATARPGVLDSIGSEVARMGPTLVLGALAAGAVKGFVPAAALGALDVQPLLGAAALMLLAFLLSICSQADAFVAAALPLGTLPRLAFLTMGPVLDLRLAAMYRRTFGTRWVAGYAAVVVPAVLVLCTVWTTWGPR